MIGNIVLNYRIISLIGEGGMGKVYLAEHQSLGRFAAIKILLPELARNEHIRQRFINEARTLSKLNHQNIVTLYDFSDAGDDLLLVMEFVEGTSVEEIIEETKTPITEQRCLYIFKQVLEGFSYAHKRGIVHRDIKPANIVLQSDDTPKILDFGIAKIVEGDVKLTKTGTRMGSVVYMSPEQVMGRDVDQRSDIYSLGVTLFEMLAGRLPYDTRTESEFDIQTKIVREPIPQIRAVNPSVSETAENVIIKATEKDVNYRFQNCEEFIIALNQNAPPNLYNKTIFQQPSLNKTVFQSGPVNLSQKNSSKKNYLPLIGIGAAIVLAIVVLFYIISNNDKQDVEKLSVDKQKSDLNVKTESTIDLNGYYEGTIKDGTRWIVNITRYDGRNFEGYNTIYWPSKGSGGLTTSFTGYYDKTNEEIIMNESEGKGSGRFTGRLTENGMNMQGTWSRYSDGGSFSWNLSKDKGNSRNDYSIYGRFPEASERYLNEGDLSGLSQYDLKIMRNEIFARHGYIFKTDEMRNHFESQSWYTGRYSNVDGMLLDIEKSNINLIKRYER